MYEYTWPARFPRLFGDSVSEVQCLVVLDGLERTGGPDDIPAVTAAAVTRSARVRRRAAEVLGVLLRRAPTTWVPRNEAVLRGLAELWRLGAIHVAGIVVPSMVVPGVVASRIVAGPVVRAAAEGQMPLLCVLSCHGNGFVREAAVRGLTGGDPGLVLPFLLLRHNDWVPQIRDAAVAATENALAAPHARAWARFVTLLERLVRGGRADHRPFRDRVRRWLVEERPDDLRDAVRSGERDVRRTATEILLDAGPLASGDVTLLLASDDPIVRMRCVRQLIAGDDVDVDVLHRQTRDRFAPIAALCLDTLARRSPAQALAPLREGLLSRRGAVRRVAQHHLAAAGEDVEVVYAAVLLDDDAPPSHLEAALLGAREISVEPDAELARVYAAHPRPRVRAAALRLLVRAARDDVAPLVAALSDPSPRVMVTAASVLARRPSLVPDAALQAALADARPHVRRGAIRVLHRLDRVRAGHLLLTAVAAMETIDAVVLESLARWSRRLRPPAPALRDEDRHALLSALALVRDVCPESLVRRLDRELGGPTP